jgi:NAD(P)-dependent dehydrogenase (short-subunit alcohol dehydrogenase family)
VFSLNGKTALVTGGSRGIGRSAALALAKAGADVAVVGRDSSQLGKVASEIKKLGRRSFEMMVDLEDVSSIQPMVQRVEQELGAVDILVNNAGVNQVEPSVDVSPQTWDRLMNVNLRATFFCAVAVARGMLQRRSGKIINVASEAGLNGLANHAAYGASKGGVIMLTKDLAVEWGPSNVQVNAVCPGATATGMTLPAMEVAESRASILGRGVSPRITEPDEVAAAIVYLASREADMVVGQALSIDGGSTPK